MDETNLRPACYIILRIKYFVHTPTEYPLIFLYLYVKPRPSASTRACARKASLCFIYEVLRNVTSNYKFSAKLTEFSPQVRYLKVKKSNNASRVTRHTKVSEIGPMRDVVCYMPVCVFIPFKAQVYTFQHEAGAPAG